MKTLLVWILVTTGGYNGNVVSYSPPLADLKSCEFLMQNVPTSGKCIQVRIPK